MEILLYSFIAFLYLFCPLGKKESAALALSSLKNVVVATLFPMMVLTRAITGSSFMNKVVKVIEKSRLWKRLNLSSALIPSIVSGIISGFPTSAKEIERLLEEEKITPKEASKAIALSCAPSPAFVIGIVGRNLSHGILMFVIPLFFSYFYVCKIKSQKSASASAFKEYSFAYSLSSSVASALNVSGNIVFFTLTANLFSFLPERLTLVISALAELGSGSVALSGSPVLLAFLTGWGGISALCQIKAEAPKADLKPYVKIRLCSAFILAGLEEIFKISPSF